MIRLYSVSRLYASSIFKYHSTLSVAHAANPSLVIRFWKSDVMEVTRAPNCGLVPVIR